MRLLLVEDEAAIAEHLVTALRAAGWVVEHSADGEEAHYLGETGSYDAVVLDLGLPGLDGLSVLKRWRSAGMAAPVLILTARGSWHEKVEGIDAGADDYLAKPFVIEELLARLRALRRRAGGHSAPCLVCGDIRLDPRAAKASVAGRALPLTALEYRILDHLMHRQGRIVSRAELAQAVYEDEMDPDSNSLEVVVGRLRRKLGRDAIATVRGMGYRLDGA